MNHWTLTLGRSTRRLFLYLMVHGKLLGHRSCTLHRLRPDWISCDWTSMREAFSGLYGATVHMVRLRDLNGRGNGTEFTVGWKTLSDLQSTFFHDHLFVLSNKGRKHQKMSGILQQQRGAYIQKLSVKLQPQQILYVSWSSYQLWVGPAKTRTVQPVCDRVFLCLVCWGWVLQV